jgi:hypothetical protein
MTTEEMTIEFVQYDNGFTIKSEDEQDVKMLVVPEEDKYDITGSMVIDEVEHLMDVMGMNKVKVSLKFEILS